ncbi:MAP kinase-activated protein kinase 2 (Fragment) [Seminavis robusta]|uniref:MAP kinase-activated protein kinase 2 n=1 Tax=Seminavis robusta TaxID=568900 RepID=A0A9N8DMP5_9STRA
MGNDTSRPRGSRPATSKQKTGRSGYQPTAPRPPRQNNRTTATEKSDRSIKISVRNVQKDVSMKSADQRRKQGTANDDSVKTFAASLATQSANHYRKGNDFVMITDALSDVRINYHIDAKEVGHGHYGVVRKCRHRESGDSFAIKSIRKAKVSKIEVLKREIDILKEVRHPNIIQLEEVYEDERYLHLVTELCTGGELFDRIIAKTQSAEGHFSEHDAATLVRDILDAIRYCHSKGIVHRDLKPENFLFLTADDSPIKIIDFGLSRHDDSIQGIMKTKVGTPYYVAPEVLRREYTNSCDIWSIGVISYILLCGYPPFYGDSDAQIFDAVKVGKFDFPSPEWDDISQLAKDFVVSLLKKLPKDRPTAEQAMKLPWLINQLGDELPKHTPALTLRRGDRGAEFSKYLGMKKLRKEALGCIASNLTQEQVGYLGEIFKSIDKGGDGVLTLNELDQAIARGNIPASVQDDLRSLRDKLSLSEDATLNWKDFLSGTIDKTLAMREDNIRMVFNHFKQGADADHLKFEDVVEIFGGEAQALEIIQFMDSDGDGVISFEDFRKAVEESLAEGDDDFDVSV